MAILMTLPLIRIISGGQTGADQAGLEAGWAPKGFRTESGLNLKLRDTYNLAEHASWEYPPRTELNVIQSDTTLIFGRSDSPGTKFTKNFCLKTGRGFIEVYWEAGYRIEVVNSDPRLYFFVSHLERHISRDGSKGVRVLNVAGNRESTNPGIYDACLSFLLTALVDKVPQLHLRTQDHQPPGSERRCCEWCGVMIWEAKQGDSTPHFTTDRELWSSSLVNCHQRKE